ncbi:MAG: molybdenum cofactor biosynthesis protein MoaE [Anaerolineae bacterium]|nr:molybdenum cofactor biosynthesis protein MoaE [Anaerolineae bacterium]
MFKLYEITEHPISIDQVTARLADPANGAVATFVGVVRGETGACPTQLRRTLYLEYEAYPDMAEVTLRQVGEEVQARWPEIRQVAITHRVGRLEVGEIAVVIALCAGHRSQVFDALHYAIDRVKEIVPVWKKEVWADGVSEWKSEI